MKDLSGYLLFETSINFGLTGSETRVFRFENGYGIAAHSHRKIDEDGVIILYFSMKLLDKDGKILEDVKDKELLLKSRWVYSSYDFVDRDMMMAAIDNLVDEAREYFKYC